MCVSVCVWCNHAQRADCCATSQSAGFPACLLLNIHPSFTPPPQTRTDALTRVSHVKSDSSTEWRLCSWATSAHSSEKRAHTQQCFLQQHCRALSSVFSAPPLQTRTFFPSNHLKAAKGEKKEKQAGELSVSRCRRCLTSHQKTQPIPACVRGGCFYSTSTRSEG